MSRRTGPSQVKLKVRQSALLLQRFTSETMVRATGEKQSSVQTEIQRMLREGLLTSKRLPAESGQRGAPPVLYELTDDPEQRRAIAQSLDAFTPAPPVSVQPTSPNYLAARKKIDAALGVDPAQRGPLLCEAERLLKLAEVDHGWFLAEPSILAYLDYEAARIAYFRQEWDQASDTFAQLRGFFTSLPDTDTVAEIDRYREAIALQHGKRGLKPTTGLVRVRRLLKRLRAIAYQAKTPVEAVLVDELKQIESTMKAQPTTEVVPVANLLAMQPSPSSIGHWRRIEKLRDAHQAFTIQTLSDPAISPIKWLANTLDPQYEMVELLSFPQIQERRIDSATLHLESEASIYRTGIFVHQVYVHGLPHELPAWGRQAQQHTPQERASGMPVEIVIRLRLRNYGREPGKHASSSHSDLPIHQNIITSRGLLPDIFSHRPLRQKSKA